MARQIKGSPYILRFIEFMDAGTSNGWKMSEVVSSGEVINRINAELPLEEVVPNYNGETSDGSGEIGVSRNTSGAVTKDTEPNESCGQSFKGDRIPYGDRSADTEAWALGQWCLSVTSRDGR
jgi:hypothetical protein